MLLYLILICLAYFFLFQTNYKRKHRRSRSEKSDRQFNAIPEPMIWHIEQFAEATVEAALPKTSDKKATKEPIKKKLKKALAKITKSVIQVPKTKTSWLLILFIFMLIFGLLAFGPCVYSWFLKKNMHDNAYCFLKYICSCNGSSFRTMNSQSQTL
uniref:Uncharacterized protein n=1 Tax=viral metagenome TaxID=1070528 RepID=A0A6C0CPS3_9ZZZZ